MSIAQAPLPSIRLIEIAREKFFLRVTIGGVWQIADGLSSLSAMESGLSAGGISKITVGGERVGASRQFATGLAWRPRSLQA